jgi:hypothetical protein
MGAIHGYYTRDGMIDVCVMISPRERGRLPDVSSLFINDFFKSTAEKIKSKNVIDSQI